MNNHQLNTCRGSSADVWNSPCVPSLLPGTLSCELLLLWSPQILSSTSSSRESARLSGPAPPPGKSLQAVSWGSPRVTSLINLSLRDQCSPKFDNQYLENWFEGILLAFWLFQESKISLSYSSLIERKRPCPISFYISTFCAFIF